VRDLLLAVPSRGRPHNIARLVEALKETCTAETDVYVGLDADDPALPEYRNAHEACGEPGFVSYDVEPGLRKVTAWTNHLVSTGRGSYRAFGQVGDDNVFRTPGWDTRIMEALEKTPFAFGNDQYPSRVPGTLSCHVFMRAEVVEKLGYFGPPSIAHMYVDVAWYAWGTACGITYLHDVLIPHLHYTTGAPHDDTYQNSYAGTGQDLQAWHAYCRSGQLNADIRKLGGTEFSDEELAHFNRALFIPERWD
jgi:hypothetical protein